MARTDELSAELKKLFAEDQGNMAGEVTTAILSWFILELFEIRASCTDTGTVDALQSVEDDVMSMAENLDIEIQDKPEEDLEDENEDTEDNTDTDSEQDVTTSR